MNNIISSLLLGCLILISLSAFSSESLAASKNSSSGSDLNLKIGPVATLLGFTMPLRGGFDGKINDFFGFGGHYGIFPELTIKGLQFSGNGWALSGRVFPFFGSLFAGFSAGQQTIIVKTSETILGASVDAQMDVNSTYFAPQIGWRWETMMGLFFGMELGWQFSLSSSATITSNVPQTISGTDEYKSKEAEVVDEGNKIGKANIPSLALLQIGYYF